MVLIPAWALFLLCVGLPMLVYLFAYDCGRRDGYLSGMQAGLFNVCNEERERGREL